MADVVVDPQCNDPKELFGQGVRAFVLQDYEAAVSALSKASELLVAQHQDDMHDSLAEVYLYYGKSLLGLAREQNEALGDAVPKNSAEESEDDEEIRDEVEDSEETKTEGNNDETGDNQSKVEQNGEEPTSSDKPGCSGEAAQSGDNEDEKGTEENGEEDPSDLQVAWEVLELAKKIFQRQGQQENLAETLIILGEVSLESENFQSAINDIKQGLEIQKELMTNDSRPVAETFYKLGMAYSTNSQIDEAVGSFNSSLEYLKCRIKTLEANETMNQEQKDEVDEIKSLIPEIEDKIADMQIYKEEAIKKITEAVKEPSKSTTDGAAGTSKQATNISHLVKRKRKMEEEQATEGGPAKKPSL